MWEAIGQLIPIALAAAVSTIPIMATILILVSDNRDQAAFPYSIGWVVGAAVFVTVATVAAEFLPEGRLRNRDAPVGALEIVIGGAMIVFGLLALRRRQAESTGRMPRWLTRVDSLDSVPAFGLGLALNVRPKALLLVAAAGLILRTASLDAEADVIAIAVYTAVATSTVVAPVLLTFLSPDRMRPRLQAARDWLTTHGHIVTALTMVVVGCLLLVVGFTNV